MNSTDNRLKIRPETPLDHQVIAQLNILGFGQVYEAQLVERIRHSDGYIPELSLVAELNDELIIGHILFSYVELVNEEKLSILALAPLVVRPEFQKQGVGSKLVQTGLEVAQTRGESLVVVLGHPWFYSNFGFKPASDYGIVSPFDVPEDAFMVKFLKGQLSISRESLVGSDLKYNRKQYQGKVVYPATFRDEE